MKVAVVKESAPGERRVALVPEMIARLRGAGLEVLVESGAGDGAWLADSAYAEAGATVVSRAELLADADLIVMVGKPDRELAGALRPGQAILGLLNPLADPGLAAALAARGVTAISLDGLPRTLTRAQGMDALSSQANVAGYKAALVGAAAFGRFFPMLTTAAGTARPAKVLILGTGVAGLQAIGTARRLGAVVSAYDVRPQTKTEVESLGGTFIELTSVRDAAGEGGYARALTDEERQAQQAELAGHIARHDVVITTAQVPGRKPPLLVTEDALKAMTRRERSWWTWGPARSAATWRARCRARRSSPGTGSPSSAPGTWPPACRPPRRPSWPATSPRCCCTWSTDGALAIDPGDEIQAGVVITHDGAVIQPATAALLAESTPGAGSPGGATP